MVAPAEETFLYIVEMIGAFAAAISGIRLAALKRFDWFGAYIVGLVTALGGGTLRDMMLGNPVFWVASLRMFLSYFIGTAISMVIVVVFSSVLVRREKALLVFDAIGLAMFTVIGLEKALTDGRPMGIAIAMGLVTGAFGGVLRDILINEEPLIFRKDIYAMASLLGGVAYWGIACMGGSAELSALGCMASCITIRMFALKYGWALPIFRPVKHQKEE
ncbi:MAG: trimeric intracellular cation channel family protein [Muribaculaceae bacterium]|nr:trimeric intracellular cation channel family protein [Muribaculaceae bacterium]